MNMDEVKQIIDEAFERALKERRKNNELCS